MSDHQWSPQQAAALDRVGKWLADPSAPQVFRLFGYAGTGKTTLARHLAYTGAKFPIFAAFTGKAASVLREKGCSGAQTLHSLLYNVTERDRTKLEELKEQLALMPPTHPDYREVKAEVELETDKIKRPWFYVNEESLLRQSDLLVCDEVSMVDQKLGKDMESFGKKILVLGDPAQLPPIMGGGYFTKAKPEVLLTEIHRQALDNPILEWATMARQGKVIPWDNRGAACKMKRESVDDAWLSTAGQILTGKNETRNSLNQRIRTQLGFTSTLPQRKDKLVALSNDRRQGLLNGTLGQAINDAMVDENNPTVLWMSVVFDRRVLRDLRMPVGPFRGEEIPEAENRTIKMDYGYALTVHKSQGSQWPSVVLYDDGFAKREQEMRNKWLYTAITRAEKQLYIVTP